MQRQIDTYKSHEDSENVNWQLNGHGINELEELLGVVHLKEERIEELEEALRESVRITAERERGLQQEEVRRKHIMEKVRILSFISKALS